MNSLKASIARGAGRINFFLFLSRKRDNAAKIVLLALPAVIMGILLMGCERNFLPASAEITSYEIVRVLGIDRSEESPEQIELTLVAERAKPSPGTEGGGMMYEVMSSTGPTAFEAAANLRALTDKKQIFGYVDYIIFGESAASHDLTKYADYPARNPEIRYSPQVFIARGTSAKELLSVTISADKYIGDSLDNLKASAGIRSDFGLIRNIELMNMLDNPETAAVIPAIEARPPEDEKMIEGELPEKELSAAGYAVIRDFKLAGFFDGGSARGYNFLTEKTRSCALSVTDHTGNRVALDVLSAGIKIKPHFNGTKLESVTYTVRLDANVAEQRSLADINTKSSLDALASQLESIVTSEAEEAVAKSKEFMIDCFGLGGKIKMQNPYKWRKIEDNWRELYKDLKININAEAAVRRVYDLRQPSGFSSVTRESANG